MGFRQRAQSLSLSAFLLLSVAYRGDACGPPPPMRYLVGEIDQILLVETTAIRKAETSTRDCADCDVTSDTPDHVWLRVLETWKGDPGGRTLELDAYGFDPPESRPERPGPIMLWLAKSDGPPGIQVRHAAQLAEDDVAPMRAAVQRTIALDVPDPSRDQIFEHIRESMKHRVTLGDAMVELFFLSMRAREPFRLSDPQAADLSDVLAAEGLEGETLARVVPFLAGRLTSALRDRIVERVDEAVRSEDPSFWAERLVASLGPVEPGPQDVVDEAPDGPGVDEEAQAEESEESAPVDEAELERQAAAELKAMEDRDRARWQELRASWPERRRALLN